MSGFNCGCNAEGEWRVAFDYDCDSAADGWDGDEPLDEGKFWTPYFVTIDFQCIRCGRSDEMKQDGNANIWASDDEEGREYLRSVIDEMLPAGVTSEDVQGFWP